MEQGELARGTAGAGSPRWWLQWVGEGKVVVERLLPLLQCREKGMPHTVVRGPAHDLALQAIEQGLHHSQVLPQPRMVGLQIRYLLRVAIKLLLSID